MALPQLTPEQRAAALEKAVQARKVRIELKDKLKCDITDLLEVLKQADENEIVGRMRVSVPLEALSKVGKAKAQDIMNDLEIMQTRRLRGLSDCRRRALLERSGYTVKD